MKTLLDNGHLHGDCLTVTGRTIAENLKSVKWNPHQDVVRSADKPITVTGGVVGLKGNLAPEGAIVKVAGMSNLKFTGPARCFDREEDAFEVGAEEDQRGRGHRDPLCRGRAAVPTCEEIALSRPRRSLNHGNLMSLKRPRVFGKHSPLMPFLRPVPAVPSMREMLVDHRRADRAGRWSGIDRLDHRRPVLRRHLSRILHRPCRAEAASAARSPWCRTATSSRSTPSLGTLNVKLTDKELAERKTKWKARATNHTSGALWKYAQQVGPAVGWRRYPSRWGARETLLCGHLSVSFLR